MKKFITAILLVGVMTIGASAQTETPDSLRTDLNSPAYPDSVHGNPLSGPTEGEDETQRGVPPLRPSLPLSLSDGTPADLRPFHYSMPTDGRIFIWRSGGIFGSGGSTAMPGLMGIENGSINFIQQAGRFTFTAHADAVKYGYFNGLQTSFGYGGSISYRFSDRVSMTLFGSYYTPLNASMMTPAIAGYTSITNFGGYVDYRFSDRWGVKVGAQGYRRSDTQGIMVQPVAIPYYKISKNAEIGVDVGGMLYQILRGSGKSSRPMNPTIAPPKMGTLPVGPRR